ncbi:MAG TPA: transposase [Candidatus Acidoferrales bacterium]|nr:transposase [Candidatus Acidoferrales bacterium]
MSRIIRRIRQSGVYFVTTHTWQRRKLFQKEAPARIFLEQVLDCRERGFYKLHAYVIMPDHLHLLLTPTRETSLEKAMQMIKGGSAHKIRHDLHYHAPVWQPGFHDRWMRDADEYQFRLRYISENPVRARLVERAEDYALSSASGRFPLDLSQFERRTSGAEAPLSPDVNVAAKAATHKATGALR